MGEVCRKGSKGGKVEDKKDPKKTAGNEAQSPVGRMHVPHVEGQTVPLLH